MSPSKQKPEFYFEDPRLSMTILGRALVRFSYYVGYLTLGSLSFLLLFSRTDSKYFWLGLLLIFFLIDRILHIGECEEAIVYLRERGRYNLADFLAPRVYNLIESSLDRSVMSRSYFRFVLIAKLSERQEIQAILTRLEIPKTDFIFKAERDSS